MIAFLATSSLGALWSICSLDMGHIAILDRFKQIKPKLLIAQNGYIHAGKAIDRCEVLKKINNGLERHEKIITVPVITNGFEGDFLWLDLLNNKAPFNLAPVAFDHLLWIVCSSGTTGNLKPIVHGHGGILLETVKQSLHHDLTEKDHFSWLTSSGWTMWNAQWTALAQGRTHCGI